MPAGRPTKKTDARVEILMECLEACMPVDIACNFAKIDKKTFYNWLESDENFSTQIAYARSKAERMLISNVIAEKQSWKLLKNHDPKNFKDEVPELTQNNYKLIVNTTNGAVDLSGNVRHNEESEARESLPIE